MSQIDCKIKLNNLVFHQLKYPQLTEFLIFSILTFALWPLENKILLASWYIASMVLCALRFGFTTYYNYHPDTQRHVQPCTQLLAVMAFTSGLSWGVLGSVLMPAVIYDQILILFLIVGVVAVGNLFYYPVKNIFLVFLIPAYLPHIAWLCSQGSVYWSIAGMAVIYFALMQVISINSYKMVMNAVRLQFENRELVTSLKDAKNQLEFLNEKLAFEATHDALTDLLNRKSLDVCLAQALDLATHNRQSLAVLFCDLDKFKEINDTHGHDVGDKILIAVSQRMQSTLNTKDAIARLGGDEFIIVLNEIKSIEEAQQKTIALLRAIQKPLVIDAIQFKLEMSIGISLYPFDGTDDRALLKHADEALYKAKQNGRNGYAFYATAADVKITSKPAS